MNINRRRLKLHTLDQVMGDALMLHRAGYERLGSWTLGRCCDHLAATMDCSIDGFPFRVGPHVRLVGMLIKRRLLDPDRGFPAGVKFPASARAALEPGALTDEQGLARLQAAIDRLNAEPARAPSPLLGRMTREQWDLLHCNHAALHLSFLVPREPADRGSNVTRAEFDSSALR